VKLGVREAARMLNLSETRIYRLVDQEEIPFVMIQHHPMFHRVELLEWAMEMELPVSADLYEHDGDHPLMSALQRGGGHVLSGNLDTLALDVAVASPADRDVIRAVIAARENEMFVARTADWIAIPKARSPIVCADAPAHVILGWCRHRAIVVDDAPMNVVFLIVAPTVKDHLRLLSRLSLALHDKDVRIAAQQQGAFVQVVAEVRRFEDGLAAAKQGAQS